MQLVEIDRSGIDACYKEGVVKPNEFRQIVNDYIEKELYLRATKISESGAIESFKVVMLEIIGINYLEKLYQELSDCDEDTFHCIINIATNNPEKLLLSEEECKKLSLAHTFYKKSVIVRDCSDIFKHPLIKQPVILVDKETLRSLSYLTKHFSTGKSLLRGLNENKE